MKNSMLHSRGSWWIRTRVLARAGQKYSQFRSFSPTRPARRDRWVGECWFRNCHYREWTITILGLFSGCDLHVRRSRLRGRRGKEVCGMLGRKLPRALPRSTHAAVHKQSRTAHRPRSPYDNLRFL